MWWHNQSYWVFCFGLRIIFFYPLKHFVKAHLCVWVLTTKASLQMCWSSERNFALLKNSRWQVAQQNNKEQPQCTVMFHLTASKIQMSFTGFVLPWLPLKRSQAVNLFTQSKHKPESADFVLLGKCLSVKKEKKEEEKKENKRLRALSFQQLCC